MADTAQLDRPANKYDEETFNLALTVLAAYNGNGRRASRELQANHDIKIAHSTLYDWTACQRYHDLRDELMADITPRLVQECEAIALKDVRLERMAQDQLEEALENGDIDAKDLPKSLKFLADSKSQNIDKAQLLSGKPTERVHHDAASIIRKLSGTGVVTVIDGTAEELPAQPIPARATAPDPASHAHVRDTEQLEPASPSVPAADGD